MTLHTVNLHGVLLSTGGSMHFIDVRTMQAIQYCEGLN